MASSYLELTQVVSVVPDKNNLISFKSISENSIIEIKKVTHTSGSEIKFKVTPSGVVLDENTRCLIEFSHFPSRVDYNSEIDYYISLNDITFAIGVVAEYLYIRGNIDEIHIQNTWRLCNADKL